ncbi:MAG: I78 family peptidase inhibitor [Sphingomonas sp.]
MIRFAIPLIALSATGCMHDGRPQMPGPARQCNADRLDRFVGQQRSPRIAERAKRASGARTVRWLEPGTVTTMEFRADRLSLTVNERGRITGARCG